MRSTHKSMKNPRQTWGWLWYILPALVVYVLFMALPLLNSLRLSLYSGSGFTLNNFVGFDNYRRLFMEPATAQRFWNAFGNTWIFFLIHMVVQNTLGLFFALLLSSRRMGTRVRDIFRTIIFIPTTLAILVTGFLWKLLLNPQWGLINMALDTLGLDSLSQPWLGQSHTALVVVSLVSSWQWVGIPMMIFLAGLQNIPEDLYEAAAIDGASEWTVFWRIKLPLLSPIIGVVSILTFTGNFNAFDVVYAMTGANGPPNYATDILGTYFYRIGIAGQHPVGIPDMGLGAAVASVIFLILFLGVMIMRGFFSDKSEAAQ
ncbi:carbohydrate ABC transporter permease [Spirochaeta lutea]|uniref:ABC transporter permease n=1 Tax=Spirochaeta lutea TaxID=1480694 RepID=A0A098QX06_9SPIO|nr:sugar ABC transporter permease [Spirochaeta lutea]KGE71027.1 ABC transporter permease [Spirochaeta lutea]